MPLTKVTETTEGKTTNKGGLLSFPFFHKALPYTHDRLIVRLSSSGFQSVILSGRHKKDAGNLLFLDLGAGRMNSRQAGHAHFSVRVLQFNTKVFLKELVRGYSEWMKGRGWESLPEAGWFRGTGLRGRSRTAIKSVNTWPFQNHEELQVPDQCAGLPTPSHCAMRRQHARPHAIRTYPTSSALGKFGNRCKLRRTK